MKASEVYRKAAKEVADLPFMNGHRCCCGAIRTALQDASKEVREGAVARFAEVFKPRGKNIEYYWFGDYEDVENQEPRVLALCFMAAIAEDEERGNRRRSS